MHFILLRYFMTGLRWVGDVFIFINSPLNFVPIALPCDFAKLEIVCIDVSRDF